MIRILLSTVFVCLAAAQAPAPPSLRGTVTDPSGASVPGALVQLVGPGGQQRSVTNDLGAYQFPSLRPGKYRVRVIARGFTVFDRRDVEIRGPLALDAQLAIATDTQVINVEDEANRVNTDPASNGTALVLGEKELAALSDDPDELEQQLQAMAGPAAGPNGGQIYIDGFTGGKMPPKASIREVRINSNPFSPEYDRPGFGRIEIFTRPGADRIRGQFFMMFNDSILNSRNPLLTQPGRPPYRQFFGGGNLSGPIRKGKASFGLDFERRAVNENAFIFATALDGNLNPVAVNQAVVTPQSRTTISPRLDLALNRSHTLVARYQNTRMTDEGNGIGDFSLASRAFDSRNSENTIQLTETAILSSSAINETRFQFMRSRLSQTGDNSVPALSVQGAFEGGGAQIGDSGNLSRRWEITNLTTLTRGAHVVKWGARLRRAGIEDTSVNNFGGSYVFFGGSGPQLDAAGNPVAGTSIQLTALERYRRTLLFLQAGLSPAAIRAAGGGASQFTLNAGVPTTAVTQFDAGLFVNDDWRLRPNLTLSYGLRYEAQTNMSDWTNLSPRFGFAWGVDGGAARQAKTVIRGGFGIFYDRLAETATLQELRFNGSTQLSYLIRNPDFYPAIPAPASLAAGLQPQRLQFIDDAYRAPRTYQLSVGADRQINSSLRLSGQFVESRGSSIQRQRNINAPVGGVFPFGDSQIRLLTESSGMSRMRQLIVSPNINYRKFFLFGFYSLSYGRSNAEGFPADPYNLQAEWGPSRFGDIRHRVVAGTSVPLPMGFSASPFFMVNSGAPYNITTGRDTNGDGYAAERPSLLAGVAQQACGGGGLLYAPGFGCFNLNPAAGEAVIGRNTARGPWNVNLGMRLARSWSFGGPREGPAEAGPPMLMGGPRGEGGPGGGGRGPGGAGGPGGGPGGRIMMGGGPGGGPPPGLFGGGGSQRYNLTLSISARNALNHVNFAPPSGDLSSPYFGQYRSLAGFGPFGDGGTFNRKLDIQLRFTF